MAYLDFGVSPLERLLGDFLGVWNLKGVSGRIVIEKVIFVDYLLYVFDRMELCRHHRENNAQRFLFALQLK